MKRVYKYFADHLVVITLIILDIIFIIFYSICHLIGDISIHQNLLPELVGINLTVLIIDFAVNKKQERRSIAFEFEADVKKIKGDRIYKAIRYVDKTLKDLEDLLISEIGEINEYKKFKGKLARSVFAILELCASNETIEKKGSVLEKNFKRTFSNHS